MCTPGNGTDAENSESEIKKPPENATLHQDMPHRRDVDDGIPIRKIADQGEGVEIREGEVSGVRIANVSGRRQCL